MLTLMLLLSACAADPSSSENTTAALDASQCDPDNGGFDLPDDFCAVVVADDLGTARHMAVRDNGDVYVILRSASDEGGIAALRDTTGDGKADRVEYFGQVAGTGIDIYNGYLYASTDSSILRYRLPEGELVPMAQPEVVVAHVPEQGQHAAKSIAIDEQTGSLYVNVGAPSNACQDPSRSPGVPGQDPCPLLENFGGIWRFDAAVLNQTQEQHGTRYATGIRNAVALAWNSHSNTLYAAQHGRDQLHTLWPDLFTDEQSAELPAEELFMVEEGDNFGWPYCYYDQLQGKKVLAPEYGGDGQEVGRCAQFEDPIVAFPGHYAPNDLLFYSGDSFPDSYRHGAFIAFHGSWNRAPLEQKGYLVAFVPFDGARPSGDWSVFADGFKGGSSIQSPGEAAYRPMGLAQGPDGSLYISDSSQGRIWRVISRSSGPST